MSELQTEKECQMAVVYVHEGTTLAAIVTALKEKFSVHCHRNLVCFTLTFMDRDAENGVIKAAARFKRRHRYFQLSQNYHLPYCPNI